MCKVDEHKFYSIFWFYGEIFTIVTLFHFYVNQTNHICTTVQMQDIYIFIRFNIIQGKIWLIFQISPDFLHFSSILLNFSQLFVTITLILTTEDKCRMSGQDIYCTPDPGEISLDGKFPPYLVQVQDVKALLIVDTLF